MATVKGVIRSYGAAVRKIEREQQKNARAAAKRFKEQQKLEEIANAEQAVQDWGNYVNTIKSLHKNCTQEVDWDRIKNTPKPIKPKQVCIEEIQAKSKLDNFKPSFFDKLFGLTKKKTNVLLSQLEKAKKKDFKINKQKENEFLTESENWKELQEISLGIEQKQVISYQKAITFFNPFSDIGELGTHLNFNFKENYIDIDLHVNSLEVIPDYELKQTSTGKLSKKDMPKSRFNELYQDHICSAAIRISREVFAYLPVEYTRVNAMAKIVNTATGHLEEQPILSVILLSETINSLNLETIDPSDSMQNFVHNMKFTKTKGFSVVKKVDLKVSN